MAHAQRAPEWNRGRWRRREVLLSPTGNGPVLTPWFHNEGYTPFTISVEGAFTGVVRLLGSNALDPPLPGVTTLPQLGADFTLPAAYEIPGHWEWLAVWLPNPITGLVGVYYHGAFQQD